MNVEILTANRIKELIKKEVEKKMFKQDRVIEILNKRIIKLNDEIKVLKWKSNGSMAD